MSCFLVIAFTGLAVFIGWQLNTLWTEWRDDH